MERLSLRFFFPLVLGKIILAHSAVNAKTLYIERAGEQNEERSREERSFIKIHSMR